MFIKGRRNLNYSIEGISPFNSLNIGFGGKIDYDLGLKRLTRKFYGKDIRKSSNYFLRYNPTLPFFLNKFLTGLNFTYNSNFNDYHDSINQKDSLNPLRTANNNANYSIHGNLNTFEIVSFIVRRGNPKALKDISRLKMLFQNININFTTSINICGKTKSKFACEVLFFMYNIFMRNIIMYNITFICMRRRVYILFILIFLFSATLIFSEEDQRVSSQTEECISCHNAVTPGIVEDWYSSKHSKTTPSEALKLPLLQRRISAVDIPKNLKDNIVGCYECHGLNSQAHKDNFEHFGFRINVIVSPNDCKTCHPVEVNQYSNSKKAHALKNLMDNAVYRTLVYATNGIIRVDRGKLIQDKPSNKTLHETCLGCHGTKVEVKDMKTVDTKMGEVKIPSLTNWPNQGVGRENPDGSLGACTACHPRHSFSIEIARKPYTCAQCHLEPDVPAWNVYKESKHGNIYFSKYHEWDFKEVPWVIGRDFKTPTCATCHNSLIVSSEGDVIAERTHDFGARLWVRLFGLIYSHPQPKSGNTTIIKNKDGFPLPTTFTGEPASEYLIDKEEQSRRLNIMKGVCNGCHGTAWVNSHFEKLENTLKETDAMTLAATKLILEAWEKNIEDKSNPFDETIEKLWVKQWLFYANSIRYASAMTGAPDYTTFKYGWWELSDNLQKMRDLIDLKISIKIKKQK